MMLCSVCEEYCSTSTANTCSNLKGNNTFVTGCSNLKISAVVDHETSKGHQKAMSLHNAKNSSQDEISKSAAGHALNLLKSSERSRLSHLFRNAHAVAKNNRPLSDYVWLCATDKAKGLDIGDTYLNEKAAVCFLSYISGTIQEKTTSILNSAPFFSVIMDGSTDRTGDDQESVYIRTSHKGVIHERFFEIGCPQSTSAQDLFVFITNILNKHEVDTGRLVGFGSDGASNMVGIKSGLATLLKREINEEIINVHCLCHRLELSFRDVAKQQKLYDNLITLLIGLNYFYTKSHKNKKGLLSAMEAINIKGTLPPKVTGTRWLPHLERAIVSLFKTFRAYEMHLSTSSHSNPKAEGLLKLLLSRNLMTFTVFLKDTVGPLMKLSQKLQKDGITLADSLLWIQTTIDVIDLSFTRNSDQLTDILETGKLQGVKLSGPCPEMAYRESMVKGFSDAMRCRFQLNPKDKTIVASTQILNLKNWPEDKSDLQDFGNADIQAVADHFQNSLQRRDVNFSSTDIMCEWQIFKTAVQKRYGKDLLSTPWPTIHKHFEEDCGKVLMLVDILQTLPPTSVSCETSFSQMKLIKTCRRSRLGQTTLNNLMVVKLESEDVRDFDPEKSIDRWLADSSRRNTGYARKPTGLMEEGPQSDRHSDTDSDNESEIDTDTEMEFNKDFQTEKENLENLMTYLRY